MITLENTECLFEMAKLIADYADEDLCGDFGDFIYFSPCLDAHGPRVKFYGGTKETSTTRKAPTMMFTNDGKTSVKIYDWMNKKNCPNAFDSEYLSKVDGFIQRTLPVLLLVWYNKLDEARALKFFEGAMNLQSLLHYIEYEFPEINSLQELHDFCKFNKLYSFD